MSRLATAPNRLARLLAFGVGLTVWGAALYGSTRLHQANLSIGHNICGPWGCAAVPEALLGYHLLLFTLITPLVILVGHWLSPQANARLGRWATLIGGAGLLAIVAWATIAWLVDGNAPQYAFQRGLFVLATTPDLPAGPLLVGGWIAWRRGTRRS